MKTKQMVLRLFNPLRLFNSYNFHKKQSNNKKQTNDLELVFYSKILKNDMLHYGFFDDINIEPERISIGQLEDAQFRYVEKIIKHIQSKELPVLDVGCGMGGLSNILFSNDFSVEALTPDQKQKNHISRKYPNVICHQVRFEDFTTDSKFGSIINSESLQYINLEKAFRKVEALLLSGGRWIITDYFRIKTDTVNTSGHLAEAFLSAVRKNKWKIVVEEDMTLHILPTLKLVYMYAERFLLPVLGFAEDKLKVKQAWLYYLTQELRDALSVKTNKELASIDPQRFIEEKRYMFYVLEKSV